MLSFSGAGHGKHATNSPHHVKRISRAGSVDTLSPCESIASDDLILDYEQSDASSYEENQHRLVFYSVHIAYIYKFLHIERLIYLYVFSDSVIVNNVRKYDRKLLIYGNDINLQENQCSFFRVALYVDMKFTIVQ